MKILFDNERNKKAKVAVLVSLYNYEKYICEALDSIAKQTLTDIELVVCNDFSTDNSVSVVIDWMQGHKQRFSRLAFIENDVNSGLSATRNASVAFAIAPYVFILDADNMIYPPCLERSLEVLKEADAKAAFAYAQREMFTDAEPLGNSLENLLDWNPRFFSQGNYIDAMVLHKKSALEAVGGYTVDDCFGRLGWEDYELWLKYVRAGFYGIKINQPLIRYRYHKVSMLRATTNRAKNTKKLWQRLHAQYPELIPAQMPVRMRFFVSRLGWTTKYLRGLEKFIRSKPVLLRLAKAVKRVLRKIHYVLSKKFRQQVYYALFGKILSPATLELLPGLNAGDSAAIAEASRLLDDFPGQDVSIAGEYVCVYGAGTDFSGSTTAVVAHWDPQGIVDPYVVHMCRALRSLGWKVVLSSHSGLRQSEKESDPAEWADAILYRTCSGYDFTSWKAALHCFPSLLRCNELILCNDSVFGGIGSYAPMHDAMRDLSCDFWGVTASREILPHVQSYYFVFRQSALQHESFMKFFAAVPLSDDRDLAISFEVRLALWLSMHGLRPGVYAPVAGVPDSCNPSLDLWRKLLAHNVPMLKKALLASNNTGISGWEKELVKRQYPVGYIYRYFSRIQRCF